MIYLWIKIADGKGGGKEGDANRLEHIRFGMRALVGNAGGVNRGVAGHQSTWRSFASCRQHRLLQG